MPDLDENVALEVIPILAVFVNGKCQAQLWAPVLEAITESDLRHLLKTSKVPGPLHEAVIARCKPYIAQAEDDA